MTRNITLDILKILLSFMVIGIHTGFLKYTSEVGEYLTVNGLFRIAVPIFLIINGYYFYSVLERNNVFSWFKRVIILYLFWMFVYVYFWIGHMELSLSYFKKIIISFLIGYEHLWYLPAMIGAALIIFFLKKVPLKINILLILMAFIFGVLIQYLGNYHLINNNSIDNYFNLDFIHRNFLFFGFPFFFIGVLIHKYNLAKLLSIKFTIILTIIGFLFLTVESYLNYININRDGSFNNFFSLIVLCPALFILVTQINLKGESKTLSYYASAIYFVHFLLFNILYEYSEIRGTVLTVLVFIMSLIVSNILIRINQKYKFIL